MNFPSASVDQGDDRSKADRSGNRARHEVCTPYGLIHQHIGAFHESAQAKPVSTTDSVVFSEVLCENGKA